MSELKELAKIPPQDRILLLSHCLRPASSCPGKYTRDGLQCPPDCPERCVLGDFVREARRLGYKATCIAPGGALALRFVKEHKPKGIVAVACSKELAEGVKGVKEAFPQEAVTIVTIPLLKDGCVDTEVDVAQVLQAVECGLYEQTSAQNKEQY